MPHSDSSGLFSWRWDSYCAPGARRRCKLKTLSFGCVRSLKTEAVKGSRHSDRCGRRGRCRYLAFELTDQIGRTRGSSQTDPDLQEAAGLLQYSGTKWVFDFSTSLAPTATSEAQYRKARRALLSYNGRLSEGNAVFERRADNLMATLDRFALDLGSSSAVIDRHIAEHAGDIIDLRVDDIFYNVKGQLCAYYYLLRELEHDFANIIEERELGSAWRQMLGSMKHVAELDPWVVVNGQPDAQVMPSHLAAQGFFLLRARTQLREITNILLK